MGCPMDLAFVFKKGTELAKIKFEHLLESLIMLEDTKLRYKQKRLKVNDKLR